MKSGIRILAVDDSRFRPGDAEVLIVGIVGRESTIEGVLSCSVAADGNNSTANITRMIRSSRFLEQVKLIAINGTTVAGLNVVDIVKMHKALKLPIIAVTRKKPHPEMLKRSIMSSKAEGKTRKTDIIERISESAEMHKVGGFYVQCIGIEKEYLSRYIGNSVSLLRLAHMVASGVSCGESRGRM